MARKIMISLLLLLFSEYEQSEKANGLSYVLVVSVQVMSGLNKYFIIFILTIFKKCQKS